LLLLAAALSPGAADASPNCAHHIACAVDQTLDAMAGDAAKAGFARDEVAAWRRAAAARQAPCGGTSTEARCAVEQLGRSAHDFAARFEPHIAERRAREFAAVLDAAIRSAGGDAAPAAAASRGPSPAAIRRLQNVLIELSLYDGVADGVMGPRTRAAITDLLRGTPPDRMPDLKTDAGIHAYLAELQASGAID
jgi:hypothetical protein